MELFDKTEVEKKPQQKMATCPECGNEFPFRSNKIYCSNNCRTKASIVRTATGGAGNTISSESSYMPLAGLNAQSQYIIKHQETVIKDWKEKYNQERAERKRFKEQNQKLRDELAEIKIQQKLAEAEKPSGLNGFLGNPFMQQLVPHIGPVIAELGKRLLVPAAGIENATGDQQMTGLNDLVNWLAMNPLDFQHKFHMMVSELSKIENNDQRSMALDNIIKFLSHAIQSSDTNGSYGNGSASAEIAM